MGIESNKRRDPQSGAQGETGEPTSAGEDHSEMRPHEHDPRKADGVAEFKRAETDAERHRRQSD